VTKLWYFDAFISVDFSLFLLFKPVIQIWRFQYVKLKMKLQNLTIQPWNVRYAVY
jgi:hypothetical protein